MADRPNVGRNRLEIGLWQGHSYHRRHRARMFFGLRHTVLDCLHDAIEAPVAPEPLPACEVGVARY
jgi:hypothetical protein